MTLNYLFFLEMKGVGRKIGPQPYARPPGARNVGLVCLFFVWAARWLARQRVKTCMGYEPSLHSDASRQGAAAPK